MREHGFDKISTNGLLYDAKNELLIIIYIEDAGVTYVVSLVFRNKDEENMIVSSKI